MKPAKPDSSDSADKKDPVWITNSPTSADGSPSFVMNVLMPLCMASKSFEGVHVGDCADKFYKENKNQKV